MGFGIASRVPRERQAPEPPDTIIGTLAYIGAGADRPDEPLGRLRSDLYALGATLYELLTGRVALHRRDPIELIHCHIAREPVPPHELASALPAPRSMIVMKLLAKTAEERYQTAAGVEADLRKCLTAWESFGRIEPFPPGLQDASDRLMIPEKLYGREGEDRHPARCLRSCREAWRFGARSGLWLLGHRQVVGRQRAAQGHRAASRHLHFGKIRSAPQGHPPLDIGSSVSGTEFKQLLNGKADDNRPLARRDQGSCRQSGPLADRPHSRPRSTDRPTADRSGPLARRCRTAVSDRVPAVRRVFARAEHPLVIFVDDLQWLDPATLTLIEYLLLHPGHAAPVADRRISRQ